MSITSLFPVTDERLSQLPFTFKRFSDRESWLDGRSHGVGASEAAIVQGVSTFSTELELWMLKSGHATRSDADFRAEAEWGLRLQPAIAQAYADQTGEPLADCEGTIVIDEEHRTTATLDYLDAENQPVEVKKVLSFQRDKWADGVPQEYLIQVQQQIHLTGANSATIVVLLGDCDFRTYPVDRDDVVIDEILSANLAFWDRVESGDPPMPDFEHSTTADLLREMDADESRSKVLDFRVQSTVNAYLDAKDQIRQFEAERNKREAMILHAMDGATLAMLPDGRRLVRKRTKGRNSHWRLTVKKAAKHRR